IATNASRHCTGARPVRRASLLDGLHLPQPGRNRGGDGGRGEHGGTDLRGDRRRATQFRRSARSPAPWRAVASLTMTPGRCIVPLRRTQDTRVRLFCFPHAGAGASTFRAWSRTLPAGVDVLAIQAPGREARLAEAPFRDLPPLVTEVAGALEAYDDCPMAFF